MNNFELSMRNITIEFPGVKALNEAKLDVRHGEIHALIGANGAGKSTMMKVLSGSYTHWTGDMFLNGEHINIRSVKDAKSLGIETVYQEVDVALIPYLSVAENIMIDEMIMDMHGKHFVNWKEISNKAKAVLKKLNVNLRVNKKVEHCTLAEKQMVLIARSISRNCKLLILDEPTAPLSNKEADELFRIVKDLRDQGVAIVFISHRLPEIFSLCDHITIMRDGKHIVDMLIKDTNQKQVVEFMLGRSFEENYPKYEAEIGDIAFEVVSLSDRKMLKDISMHVRKGEIVGIAGLVGAGKTELCKALFGAESILSGQIKKDGQVISIKNPTQAVRHKLALVPEERRKEGVLVAESVYKNLTLPSIQQFSKYMFMLLSKERKVAKEMIHDLGIKTPTENQKVKNLSGGNQQKVVVGKWLIADADLYIFDEPTKGVDVGAKKDIFELIGRLVNQGKSVIYASCENAELLSITDRIYVMYDGRIVQEVKTKDASEDEILYYSAGGNNYERQI
ncbi:MAG: sugar ABC transporter ATP-binding protein [Erysipelothrix sp.]|jgi:simple sugar transport system ATP-binding protein|nr:sugar ABC transporter ATP-binding protein [Erysipelothrix sp.]